MVELSAKTSASTVAVGIVPLGYAVWKSFYYFNLTKMAQVVDTTLFIKNGPCMTGLGLGGEGFLSFSVATPTGEGVSNPRTFTRVRRCVMVDNLKIY